MRVGPGARAVVLALLVVLAACGREPPPVSADAGLPAPQCFDNDGDGFQGTGDCSQVPKSLLDCDDLNAAAQPQGTEVCDQVDNDCDGQIDEGLPVAMWYRDADGDGVGGSLSTGSGCSAPPTGSVTVTGDCNDDDSAVRPGAAEVCNGSDDDCDGVKDNGLPAQDFYLDGDGDGFGDETSAALKSCQTTVVGRVPNKADCNDANPTIKPGATELCNRVDDNCDQQVDNGISYTSYYPDLDGDGFGENGAAPELSCAPVAGKVTNSSDCNDMSAAMKPGAPEVCNGLDDNCDTKPDNGLLFQNYLVDADGDGFGAVSSNVVSACAPVSGRSTVGGDCNDADPAVRPGAIELCNGIDDNCAAGPDDGLTFVSYYTDNDGDGFGAGAAQSACAPVPGKVTNSSDCNDLNPSVKPGAPELCNGVDDNCVGGPDDGLTFATYYPDVDGDGFGNAAAPGQASCLPIAGKVTNRLDCDDTRFAAKPGAPEVCNGLDDNCVAGADEGLTFVNYYPDLDHDGYGSEAAQLTSACSPPVGMVTDHTDCSDMSASIHPGAAEACNGADDNCDGTIDNNTVTQSYYPDGDGDGFGAAGSTPILSCAPIVDRVTNATDCNDSNGAIHPGATEVCNGLDDDCAQGIDDGLTFVSYYVDNDVDGFGTGVAQNACAAVPGKVTNNTDCNDLNPSVKPGAAEACNGVDDNCVGGVDEGLPTTNFWVDQDSDGFGARGTSPMASCAASVPGRANNSTDCNDINAAVRPNATEVCNAVDDDCDDATDENNPGGGGVCSTGQLGVCGPGTFTCVMGAVQCVRNVAPGTERCNGLDDNCNGGVDETFTDLDAGCSAGQGVCLRSGRRVCAIDQLSTVCGVSAGPTTAAACDGTDNDCDGLVDEPYLASTANVGTAVPWADLEAAPFYYSANGCAGGVNGSGVDAIAGGALAMGVGSDGLYFQRLDLSGAPVGAPVSAGASGLTYNDVALAQAGDGFVVAAIFAGGAQSAGSEIDVYYFDAAAGTLRTYVWSLFNPSNFSPFVARSLDSLQVVRGNGKRVTLLWREAGVGLRYARIEPCLIGGAWELRLAGCATALTSTMAPSTALLSAGMYPGVGADSAHADWGATQPCASAASLREVGVAYRPDSGIVATFTMAENASNRSADTTVRSLSPIYSLTDPDVAYFEAADAGQYFVSYVERNADAGRADLDFWMTNAASYHYAYLSFATENGQSSIERPRASVSSSRVWLSAVRYVADVSGFKRQLMSRRVDFSGAKDPASTTVELSATSGACVNDTACRPGDKGAFAHLASMGRLYYSASGASPVGVFSSTLTCQ